jgi:aldose 1-epimerase
MSVATVVLTDPRHGSEARILAGYGFNCYQFCARADDEPVEVIWSEPGFEQGDKRASGSGIPLLFPYPGRIRGQTLNWAGRSYPLEGDDRRGNAIHGYVIARPWRVIEQDAQRVVGQFQASLDAPEILDRWPADFRITATYALSGNELRSRFLVENPGEAPLPCGLGTHPYFCVPLGRGRAEDCRVQLPVTSRWELAEMLPTGRLLPLDSPGTYRSGLAFGQMTLDDVFAGLDFASGICTARIVDAARGRRLAVEFDAAFRECVVYNPPHRQAVCIEPYTCVPNAAELRDRGIDSGLRVLEPGQSFEAGVTMRLE